MRLIGKNVYTEADEKTQGAHCYYRNQKTTASYSGDVWWEANENSQSKLMLKVTCFNGLISLEQKIGLEEKNRYASLKNTSIKNNCISEHEILIK